MAGLYIHVPFCLRKCAYCDFYSIPYQGELIEAFGDSLQKEIRLYANDGWDSFSTIYFGGGTPSLLSPSTINQILSEIHGAFSITEHCEISMEANPGTIDLTNLKGFRSAGINRISLGVQSLNDEELALLGRIHRRGEVFEAVDALKSAGFDNFGLDLIYGLPDQELHSWLDSLQQAIALAPQHISCYLLQLDDDVPLAHSISTGQLQEPADELAAEMYYTTIDTLSQYGFDHYEISNFARSGFECQHNIGYWQVKPYLGLGPGAVTLVSGDGSLTRASNTRYINYSDVGSYVQHLCNDQLPLREELEHMQIQDLAIEAMIMGLRLTQGIDIPAFIERFDLNPLDQYKTVIDWGIAEGLLEVLPLQSQSENRPPTHLRLTRKGYFLSNEIFSRLL
ncbi:MAG: radical SAM family heme chaperone HemW [Acidobacteriota bacterium]